MLSRLASHEERHEGGSFYVDPSSGAKVEGLMCVKDDKITRKATVSTYERYVA